MSKFDKPVPVYDKMTVDEVLQLPFFGIPSRGIKKETCERLGIRTEFSTSKGKPVAHYFPCTKKGKVVGFKRRCLLSSKKTSFGVIGDVADCNELFNQSNCGSGKKLFICEGEYDAAIVEQTLYEEQRKPGQYKPAVVSVSFGAVASLKQTINNTQFIESFKEPIIVFDNDEDGRKGSRDMAFHYPDSLHLELTEKDPCDYFLSKGAKSLYNALMFQPKKYQPSDVVGMLDIETLLKPLKEGAKIDVFNLLNYKLQGLREREATCILAPSGVGKTTICRQLGLSLMRQGFGVDWVMMEETPEKAQQSVLAMMNKVPIPEFRQNPSVVKREKIQSDYDWLVSNGAVWVSPQETFGKMDSQRLLQRLKWSYAQGCRYAIVDHLTMLTYGEEGIGAIDEIVREIAAITNAVGIHPIVVCHIKRTNFQPPKRKPGDDFEPYFVRVAKEDARGSSAIEQLFWNIITLEPEILNEDGDRGRVRIRVEKNREWGRLGVADYYEMNEKTGLLEVVPG